MMQKPKFLLAISACLLAAPVFAQPTIGGGSCSSATVSGTYALTVSGRGVTTPVLVGIAGVRAAINAPNALSGANLSGVFQAVGTVTFDGLNKATFALTANTATASGTTLAWSGTYVLQANCAGTITVTSSGNASLTLLVYNGGTAFQLSGSDSTYAYTGSGDNIATGCSTSTLSGMYALTATGYLGVSASIAIPDNAAASTAGGAATFSGTAQFDGAGHVTVSGTISANGLLAGITASAPSTFTGSYSLGANCRGTGSVSNVSLGSGSATLSAYAGTSTLTTNLYASVASSTPDLMLIGNLMWIGPSTVQNAVGATPLLARGPRDSSPPIELAASRTGVGGAR